MKSVIVYWSGTGNTEMMAGLIQKGLENKGAAVTKAFVGELPDDEILAADLILLGCPSMGDEVLEEAEFDPWMTSVEGRMAGKTIAIFGSYDWGDGQWMRTWVERMESAGANVKSSLIVNLTPEGDTEQQCVQFGESLL